jgi:hypothetical protein
MRPEFKPFANKRKEKAKMMDPGDICICTHTHEVHFGNECSKVGCQCKQFVVIDLALAMWQELKECQKELLGASAYLATCDPVTIVQNLDSFIASLERRLASVQSIISKAETE